MSKLGSPKRVFMLSMGLLLYIILAALLMFYIEECSIDKVLAQSARNSDLRLFRQHCRLIYASFRQPETEYALNETEVSLEECVNQIEEVAAKKNLRMPSCRFSAINFLPWVHCVAFSLLTIGKFFVISYRWQQFQSPGVYACSVMHVIILIDTLFIHCMIAYSFTDVQKYVQLTDNYIACMKKITRSQQVFCCLYVMGLAMSNWLSVLWCLVHGFWSVLLCHFLFVLLLVLKCS